MARPAVIKFLLAYRVKRVHNNSTYGTILGARRIDGIAGFHLSLQTAAEVEGPVSPLAQFSHVTEATQMLGLKEFVTTTPRGSIAQNVLAIIGNSPTWQRGATAAQAQLEPIETSSRR